MATKVLPLLCVLFLICSASLVFPSAEGTRILEETKAANGNNPLNPKRPTIPSPRARCSDYRNPNCRPPAEAKP